MRKKAIQDFEDKFLRKLAERIINADEDARDYSEFTVSFIKKYLKLCLEHADSNGKSNLCDFEKKLEKLDKKFTQEISLFGIKAFDPENMKVKKLRQEWIMNILDYYLEILKSEIKDEVTYENMVKGAYNERQLEKIFLKRIDAEQKLFKIMIDTSHPLLFFRRNYMKSKLRKFTKISKKLHQETVEELFSS